MKILIISDTHGYLGALDEVLKRVRPVDYLIHCGDVGVDSEEIRLKAGCGCTFVCGNNDFDRNLPYEQTVFFPALGQNILVLHGHRGGLACHIEGLREKGRDHHAGIVCFGHTHRPLIDASDPDVTVINPGSLTLPRQEGRQPSFIIMSTDRFGRTHFTVNYLEKPARSFWRR